jgi:two-component system sensor histidine kinase UhpB
MQNKLLYILILMLPFAKTSFAQQRIIDSLIDKLSAAKEDTSKVNIYRNLAGTLKFTDPGLGIEYGKKGIVLSKKLGFDKGTAGCYLNVSTCYNYSDKLDTGLLYIDTAIVYSHKAGDPNRLGLAYLNRSDYYRQLLNFNQSLRDCDTALSYADKANNDDVRARVTQTMGSVYYQQESYSQCIPYYDKALALYRKVGNLRMTAVMLNNLGLVYKSIKDFDKAITVTADAIRVTDSLKDITNLSLFNGNLSDVYFEMGNYAQAEKYADKALEYAIKQNNEKQVAIAWNFQGNAYVKQNRISEAVAVLAKAFSVFQKLDVTDRISSTGDLLAEAYSLAGNYAKAYECMRLSGAANDSLVKWKFDDDIVAMQTKFDVKEKDKEIQLLAKDKELQRQKLKEQKVYIIASIAVALLALAGIWLAVNRYRLRQQMKELQLRNQLAADLHDEVGSSLSSIHMLSQMVTANDGGSNQKNILDKVSSNAKETMDRMSDIVWMIKPGETETGSLKQRMERFANEICSSKNIGLSIDLLAIENIKLSMAQRKNIYLIFKEAMNNAVKYSGTKKIDVKVIVKNKQLELLVKDYGSGFDTSLSGRGNGLDNMKNRTKELNGKLELISAQDGTTVNLVVPV